MRMTAKEYIEYNNRKGFKGIPSEELGKIKGTSKFGNNPLVVDGIRFDSTAEANRYCDLKMLEHKNIITELDLQPKFTLIDTYHKGEHLRASYIADFRYKEADTGKWVVEDVKGVRTALYVLKRKLFLSMYGDEYDFYEVKA